MTAITHPTDAAIEDALEQLAAAESLLDELEQLAIAVSRGAPPPPSWRLAQLTDLCAAAAHDLRQVAALLATS